MEKTGNITYVKGDVTQPIMYDPATEIAIIPHCCNNLGVMGAGVALALSQKWNGVYYYYLKQCKAFDNDGKKLLGNNSYVNPNTEKNEVIVVNMIGQDGTVSADNPKPVKYWALLKCMQELVKHLESGDINLAGKTPVFHCPKFGSDLAGGDWGFIEQMIKQIWIKEGGYDVVVYEFELNPADWGIIEVE